MSNQQVNGIIPCQSCGNTWRYRGHEQSLFCKKTCAKASSNLVQIQHQQSLVPPCAICGKRYRDPQFPYSPCCKRTCMNIYKQQFAQQPVQQYAQQPVQQYVQQPVQRRQKTAAVQGQPRCRMCPAAAQYDMTNQKFFPGCDRDCSRAANILGYTTPLH